MKFYYPLGFLCLIGVPILILIYIIKSKYTEQTVASTYLWELSDKFLKKRRHVSKLTGILTLILQILAVVVASILIAHPVFTVPNSANDYYFVLDGSASMNMSAGGASRFDKAQSEIVKKINDSRGGSTYSLVFVTDTAEIVFEGVTDKTQAKKSVENLEAGWSETDCSAAISLAQEYFDENTSADIYIVTDKAYEVNENVKLVNVARNEKNAALFDCKQVRGADGSVTAKGKVVSYTFEKTVTVELFALETIDAKPVKLKDTKVELKKGEASAFELRVTEDEFAAEKLSNFSALQLRIAEGDALKEDNVVTLYNEANKETRNVLIVREDNDAVAAKEVRYFENAMSNSNLVSVETVSSSDYLASNYSDKDKIGIYLFYGWAPEKLPKNASVWLVNVKNVNGIGARVGNGTEYEAEGNVGDGSYFKPKFTKKISTRINMITKDLSFKKGKDPNIIIHKYIKYDFPKSYFTPILSIGAADVISIGQNDNHDREVVFSFSLGQTNFGALEDFPVLVRNLLNYSLPFLVDETTYVSGEVIPVNVVAGAENIAVKTPSGKSITLDIFEKDICEFQLSETGTYQVTATVSGNKEAAELYFYACVPESESRADDGKSLLVNGEKSKNASDGYYDKLLAFFIVIAVILLADWGIYCYEQYQLR